MQGSARVSSVDRELLADFEREVWARTPRLSEGGGEVVDPTPLVELTQVLKEAAADEYGLDITGSPFRVFGKLESGLLGGSVKTRPAVQILRDAIATGRLRRGQTIFEATSGNFGIALGQMARLGTPVVALVSRKLQEGVLEELEKSGVRTVNLDVDVCPAPGVKMDPNMRVARIVAESMRERFREMGFDLGPFDAARPRFEELLAGQDVINLAKALAEAYGGFCPAQYENELNVGAHESVTGPEMDQQLRQGFGLSLGDLGVVCAFGTGGTSTGLSRFIERRYDGRKAVHVVFPREGQDVAGIRTRGKAAGLPFYRPEAYAGQHDVDFQQARRLLAYLARRKGLDIGESSALALYAVIQMVNFGVQSGFVVILADGISKYERSLEQASADELEGKLEVTLEQAKAHLGDYGVVIWTHPGYIPTEEGKRVISAALGGRALEVAGAMDVARAVTTRQVPAALMRMAQERPGRVLLVCMSGNTSVRMAQTLSEGGVRAQSLKGGISALAQQSGRPLPALVRPAA
ncbi:MAG: pyridoxal-phosphate dependent enzyme [Nitrososphaerales archaeon]